MDTFPKTLGLEVLIAILLKVWTFWDVLLHFWVSSSWYYKGM